MMMTIITPAIMTIATAARRAVSSPVAALLQDRPRHYIVVNDIIQLQLYVISHCSVLQYDQYMYMYICINICMHTHNVYIYI